MNVEDAYELYMRLQSLDLLRESPPFWWPQYGTFEVVIGAILTQNSRWHRVEASLENLRALKLLHTEALLHCNIETLTAAIQPSGMYRKKAIYMKRLIHNMTESFGTYEHFCAQVSRRWLLAQKGIGPESADTILCYACQRSHMVVDRYTQRLVAALGYDFESYDALQQWCEQVHVNFDQTELPRVYAEFHGMIVEYMKRHTSTADINKLFLS